MSDWKQNFDELSVNVHSFKSLVIIQSFTPRKRFQL